LTGHSVTLDNFSGAVGGIPARGKLAVDFAPTTRVEGQIEADTLDAPALLAMLVGLPVTPDGRGWSAEPFGKGLLDGAEGRVELRTARANITPKLTLRQARGTVKFSRSEVAFAEIEGGMADGQLRGQLVFQKRADGISANGRLRLSNADAATLLANDGKAAVTGRVVLEIDVEGIGLSPQSLIGSLHGNGVVSISRAQFAALNPKIFETAARATDQAETIDMKKIGEVASRALESGTLSIPSAEGVVTIANGQIRLANWATRAEGAALTVTGSVDLKEQNLSARLALSGNVDASQAGGERPGVSVFLNGPIANPKRTLDVSALTAWLTLRMVEQQSKQLEAMEAKRRAAIAEQPVDEPRTTSATPDAAGSMSVAPGAAPAITAPRSLAAPSLAPPLPPAIEVPPVPGIVEQKPPRAPARVQRPAVARPRPVPPKPLPLLPSSTHD
jgi:large subunit ribosomal protein L24